MKNVTILQSVAMYGGAVHSVDGDVTMDEVVIEGADAYPQYSSEIPQDFPRGGAIDLDRAATLKMRASVARGCSSLASGGCIMAGAKSKVWLGQGAELRECVAGTVGGAVSLSNEAHLHAEGASLVQCRVRSTRHDCALPPCGGGGVSVSDQATVVLGAGTVVKGSDADIGGGVMLAGLATGTLEGGVEISGNRAVQGGGVATVNGSKLVVNGALLKDNEAELEGGGLFVTANAPDIGGQTRLEGNVALNGAGVFTYVQLNMMAGGETALVGNKAAATGGGMKVTGALAVVEVQQGHHILLDANEAGQHGGGMALSLGASVAMAEAACSVECSQTMRGDGWCDPKCMSPACSWDDGDCDETMRSAGEHATIACKREFGRFADGGCFGRREAAECTQECFKASCDWNNRECEPEKALIAQCPAFDATVYSLTTQTLYIRGGTSEGFGRCSSTECLPPNTTEKVLNWTAGIRGGQAVSFNENSAWLLSDNASALPNMTTAVTIEAWVWMEDVVYAETAYPETGQASYTGAGYVISWEELSLVVFPWSDRGYAFGLERDELGVLVASAPWSVCATNALLTAPSGLITDGIGVMDNKKCSWTLAPEGTGGGGACGTPIQLNFTEFVIPLDLAFVFVWDCTDESCEDRVAVPGSPFSGEKPEPFVVVAQRGIMKVELTFGTDFRTDFGFTATYNTQLQSPPAPLGVFAPGSWHHVSASIDAAGAVVLALDGKEVHRGTTRPLRGLGGRVGVGQRLLGPIYELETVFTPHRLRGSVDEVRVWEGPRHALAQWNSTCAEVAGLEGLTLCYGMEDAGGAKVVDAVRGAAGGATGVDGFKHSPWCMAIDDGGQRIVDEDITYGEAWGFCSKGHPLLPGAGFNYDAAEMEAVANMSLPELLLQYDGCGEYPFSFTNNKALGGHGGGVYLAECDAARDARGYCFFTGMGVGGSFSLASFVGNHAGGGGGAAYVLCEELGQSCERVMQATLPSKLSGVAMPKVILEGNTAGGRFGAGSQDVATLPVEILLPSDLVEPVVCTPSPCPTPIPLANSTTTNMTNVTVTNMTNVTEVCEVCTSPLSVLAHWYSPHQLEYVPGQDRLNLSLAVRDNVGSIVVSSGEVPHELVIEALLCPTDAESCDNENALASSVVHRCSDKEGDAMCRTELVEQYIVCPVGATTVSILFSIVARPSIAPRRVEAACTPCKAGQMRVEEAGLHGNAVWSCQRCETEEYILDPNQHLCQQCPTAARCDGSMLWDDVDGAVWEPDFESGIYLLRSCPGGHERIVGANDVFVPTLQRCRPCTNGLEYVINPDMQGCQLCPTACVCDGSVLTDPVDGAVWEPDNATGVYMLKSCPAGHQKVNSIGGQFNAEVQQCRPCTNGLEYIVDPNVHECKRCPVGAFCNGITVMAPSTLSGAVWEPNFETGVVKLTACARNFWLVGTEDASGESQQCLPCKAEIEYNAFPGGQCHPCPLGWETGCDKWDVEQGSRRLDPGSIPGKDGEVWHISGGYLRLLECPPGFILVRDEQRPDDDICLECLPGTYSKVAARWGGSLSVPRAEFALPKCRPCMEGATCPGGSVIIPVQGFWKPCDEDCGDEDAAQRRSEQTANVTSRRSDDAADEVFPCPPHSCLEGGKCAPGRYGPVCGVCKPGWAMSYGSCNQCTSGALDLRPLFLACLGLALVLLLIVGGVMPLFSARRSGDSEAGGSAGENKGCWGACVAWFLKIRSLDLPFLGWAKICVSFYQVLSSFIGTYSVNWPTPHRWQMETAGASRMELMSQPGLNCLVESMTYRERIMVYLLVIPVVLAVLSLPTVFIMGIGLVRYGGVKQHPKFSIVTQRLMWVSMLFIFITYPTVSLISLQSFSCQDLGEIGHLLKADYREDCPSDHPGGFIFTWSLIFAIIYPIGIPIMILVVLFRYRVPQMARVKRKDGLILAMVQAYKRRTAVTIAADLERFTHQDLGQPSSDAERARRQADQKALRALSRPAPDFSGVEKLQDLSRKQLKTLISFDWLRQSSANPRRRRSVLPERHRSGSLSSEEGDSRAASAAAAAHESHSTPPPPIAEAAQASFLVTRKSSMKRMLLRSGSLFSNSAKQLYAADTTPRLKKHVSKEELRNRVEDMARWLKEARILTMPLIEWDGSLGTEEELAIADIGFVFKNYRVECWYYELLEICRKLISIAGMAFILPESDGQVAAGFCVSFLFLLICVRLEPFLDPRLERMQIFALLALCITLFYGMVLVNQERSTRPLSETWMDTLSMIFFVVNALVIAYPVLQIFFQSKYSPSVFVQRVYRRWSKWVDAKRAQDRSNWLVRIWDFATFYRRADSDQPWNDSIMLNRRNSAMAHDTPRYLGDPDPAASLDSPSPNGPNATRHSPPSTLSFAEERIATLSLQRGSDRGKLLVDGAGVMQAKLVYGSPTTPHAAAQPSATFVDLAAKTSVNLDGSQKSSSSGTGGGKDGTSTDSFTDPSRTHTVEDVDVVRPEATTTQSLLGNFSTGRCAYSSGSSPLALPPLPVGLVTNPSDSAFSSIDGLQMGVSPRRMEDYPRIDQVALAVSITPGSVFVDGDQPALC